MTNRVLSLLALCLLVSMVPAAAQSSSAVSWSIKPQVLSVNTAVDVCTLAGGPPCSKDVYVCHAEFSTATTPTKLTLTDKQTTPVAMPNAVAITANTWMVPPMSAADGRCRLYPGGLTVTAADANALSVYLTGKYER